MADIKRVGDSRNSAIKARKDRRMEKKLKELSKRYPNSKYEIQEVVSKPNKKTVEYMVSAIVRTAGRRAHKVSKKGAK